MLFSRIKSARGPVQTNVIDKISNQTLIWIIGYLLCRQSLKVGNIYDLKSEESSTRFETMLDPS